MISKDDWATVLIAPSVRTLGILYTGLLSECFSTFLEIVIMIGGWQNVSVMRIDGSKGKARTLPAHSLMSLSPILSVR